MSNLHMMFYFKNKAEIQMHFIFGGGMPSVKHQPSCATNNTWN